MNNKALIHSCLVMTLLSLLFLSEVRGKLNAAREYKELSEFWKSKVAREQLKKLMVMGQFADFKQEVALLIPEKIKKSEAEEEQNRLRDLASVIPHESRHKIHIGQSAKELLAAGKSLVKNRKYQEGIKVLEALIDQYPDSHHVVESHYLIVEAYSQLQESKDVIKWVDKMVELFPSNRLTGYSLLKMGQIYETEGRGDDAVRIYKTIVSVYQDKNLLTKAQNSVKQLDL